LQHESVHKGIPVIGERQLQDSIKKYAGIKKKQSLSYITLLWLHYNHWGFIHYQFQSNN